MDTVRSLHAALGGPEALWLAITDLGSETALIVTVALYYWLVNPRGGRQLGLTFALSYLLNTVLKFALNEPRPFFSDPAVASDAAKATAGGPGLPSGHAQLSATLWGMMAGQLGRPWFFWVAGLVILLVSLSRIVLGVHFLSDVVVGLLLGAAFVTVGLRGRFVGGAGLWRWAVPVVALILGAFLPVYAVGLGLLAGFWLSRTVFDAPTGWGGRVLVGVLGLALVFAVYLVFRVLPEDLRRSGIVSVLRYAAVVLAATELVPLLFRRVLPRADPSRS